MRREFWFLKALAGYDDYVLPKESEVDMQASAMLRRLYDTLIRANPTDHAERQHDLNQFMTRVIFCCCRRLGDPSKTTCFRARCRPSPTTSHKGWTTSSAAVFAVMNVPEGERGAIPPWQAAFPYVNGGLFGSIESAETVAIPHIQPRRAALFAGCGGAGLGCDQPRISSAP